MKYLVLLLLAFFQIEYCFAMQLNSIYFIGQAGDVVVLINQKTGVKYFIPFQSPESIFCIKSVDQLSEEFRTIVFCDRSKATIRVVSSSAMEPMAEVSLDSNKPFSLKTEKEEEDLSTPKSQEFYLDETNTNQAFRDAADQLEKEINIQPAKLWEFLRKLDFNKINVESFSSSQIVEVVNQCIVSNYLISDFSCLQTSLLYLKNRKN